MVMELAILMVILQSLYMVHSRNRNEWLHMMDLMLSLMMVSHGSIPYLHYITVADGYGPTMKQAMIKGSNMNIVDDIRVVFILTIKEPKVIRRTISDNIPCW
jgi:multisubunit Na+/H+ antiporter MnhC subunit